MFKPPQKLILLPKLFKLFNNAPGKNGEKNLEKAFKYAFNAETVLSGFITNPISS